jgi:lipoprotein-anchoring transpeptidase ErfK/SrfK
MMTSGEDSFPAIPLPTEEPDYIKYGRRYQRPYYKRSEKSPKDEYSVVVHPDRESALKAAKTAVKQKRGRYFGRASDPALQDAFNVYENGKVVEQHRVSGDLQIVQK